jgi:hypothetical protein
MPSHVFKWQLYISLYTALLGIPLLLFPKTVIPLMGFDPAIVDAGPFVQLTGMFLLSLTLITFRVWQKKTEEMVLGTVIVRLFIIITLAILGITGGFPFLFIMIAVVSVGVLGTLWSLRGLNLKQFL